MRRTPTPLLIAITLAVTACGGGDEPAAERTPPPAQAPVAAQADPGAQRQQVPSPRDTAEITYADGRILVDYGRPSMRGRTIMGGLVPYGQVWRLGANEATQLVTQHDLRIGGASVPKGTYSLWALPGERGWQLIVNRQFGHWGTNYDPGQDLARVPMRVERTPSPVEQLTITLAPQGTAVNLVMEWENTRASIPLEIVGGGAR
ncbi:MAG TPA: DUF2911 domain-containing protein [Longimicrobium sp.]|nr:DUF2911 domain-containing protein [Longimicrobium sp.]